MLNPQQTYLYTQTFLLHPKKTYSSTQTFSSFCCGPFRLTHPHRRFLSSATQTFSSPHRTQFYPRGHLEATHLSSPQRVQSCPQRHLEATYLSHQLGAYSCPQGHLEATQRPSTRRPNSCLQGHQNCARLPSPFRAHSCPQEHSEATHFSNHPYTPWSSIQFTFRLTFFLRNITNILTTWFFCYLLWSLCHAKINFQNFKFRATRKS